MVVEQHNNVSKKNLEVGIFRKQKENKQPMAARNQDGLPVMFPRKTAEKT